MKIKIAIVILLSIFFILVLLSALRTSGTCDEIAHHIPVGYVLLTKWDFKMDPSQPPLSRYLVAAPLKLFMNINIPDNKNEWRRPERASFGRDFFYKYNTNSQKMILLARIPVMIIGVLCGLLLFWWTSSLYGNKHGFLSLSLFCFSPVIIANAGLATTDIIATFFIFLSAYTFWLFLSDMTIRKMISAGVFLGLAQLSKYNAFLLYPIFLLLLLLELPLKPGGEKVAIMAKFLMIIIISAVVTWGGYGFNTQPILKDAANIEEKTAVVHNIILKFIPHFGGFKEIDRFLLETPVPLGAHVLGIMGVLRHSYEGHASYFMGRWFGGGNKLYFLTAFLIKNPIPMLILLAAGFFMMLKKGLGRAERMICVMAAVFFIVPSFGKLQVGIRHLLPLYPFCFMIAGRSAGLLEKRTFSFVVVILVLWQTFSTLAACPNYIGYFNEAVGGSANGYRYLRDSNLDWGQDLPALSDYMVKNGIDDIVLDYFGQADPAEYGIKYRKFQVGELETPANMIYAISVQNLEDARWTKDHKPTAIAGSSIFIYDLTGEDGK